MESTTQLANQEKSFKFSLCLPSGFNFSLEFAKEKVQPSIILERKKKSPSTIRRNKKRREEYLRKKNEDKTISETLILPSEPKETPRPTKTHVTHDRFKCDQCGEKLDTQNCQNQSSARGVHLHFNPFFSCNAINCLFKIIPDY